MTSEEEQSVNRDEFVLEMQAYIQKLELENQQLQASLSQEHALRDNARLEALNEVLGNLSHDIRTPLAAIRNSIYLLKKVTDEDKRSHFLATLEDQSEHLEQLLFDICSLTRLDSRITVFEIQRCNLNDLLAMVLERLSPLIAEKSHQVVCDFAGGLPNVLVDEDKLARAFYHILENAIYYTPSHGRIAVRTFLDGGYLMVEISDNGMGISRHALSRIFESFYREDSARSTATGRAGLGLSIARRIIENHSGRIQVDSEVGVGSTFRVTLMPLH